MKGDYRNLYLIFQVKMEEVSPEVRTPSVTRGDPPTPPVQQGRARPYVTRAVKKVRKS